MFAVIAAVLFGVVLILDLANQDLGEVLTAGFLTTAGFLCIALHLAGVGTAWRRGYRGGRGGGTRTRRRATRAATCRCSSRWWRGCCGWRATRR